MASEVYPCVKVSFYLTAQPFSLSMQEVLSTRETKCTLGEANWSATTTYRFLFENNLVVLKNGVQFKIYMSGGPRNRGLLMGFLVL